MSVDMTEFRPIPNQPSFLLHRDGRVLSLKKSPPSVLSERAGRSLVWRRVRFGGSDWRVRDLVALVWGDTSALERRTADDYYDNEVAW